MEILLTQEDLAERWKVSKRAIENWRKEGVLTPAKGVPVIRFTEKYIMELEGVKLEKTSPIMVKRLESELEHTKKENETLRQVINAIFVELGKVYSAEANKMEAIKIYNT